MLERGMTLTRDSLPVDVPNRYGLQSFLLRFRRGP